MKNVIKKTAECGSSTKKILMDEKPMMVDDNPNPNAIVLSGVTIPIDENIFSPTVITAMRSGKYENRESHVLPNILKEGDRVLEIGAGVGYISTLAARDSRTAAIRVYEANPFLIPVIKNVHKINKVDGIEVINRVLSNSKPDSKSKFYLRKDFWGSSLAEEPWDYEGTIDVQNASFSKEIEAFNPTLIICDIEGGELDLFLGAELNRVERVYMEVHQEVIGGLGMKRLFEAMSDKGFYYNQWHSCGAVVLFSKVNED